MKSIKFANILLEKNPRSLSYPSLYCRATGSVVLNRDGLWELYGPGTFDFTTYFNALSVMKLKKYTIAKGFSLHLELRGDSCTIVPTHADGYSFHPSLRNEHAVKLEESDQWQTVDLDLPVDSGDVLIAFLIQTDGSVDIGNCYYSVQLNDGDDLREVELALSTTTFKKEDFVLSNIDLINREIVSSKEAISSHFHMHVVDNGRTLDANALASDRVAIYPNPNVGGSGGFARGMIAAMEQKPKATHVLLMDDDVAVSPESIKRTYNLLTILNDEYSEAFISGAMLNYEIGEDFWEDIGYMSEDGRFSPVKPPMRLTLLHDLVACEQWEPTEFQRQQMYAAWWYCCIPMSVIEEKGLPLPFFVRCDDAEYGIRCNPKFITMNGLCIWHLSFHSRYSAAVERYQTTRNTLIAQATMEFAPKADFLLELYHNIQLELKKFNYKNAELVLDGFEDFLKGPDFIMEPNAEQCFISANRNAEKLLPFDELKHLVEAEGVDFEAISRLDVYRDRPRSRLQAAFDFISFNGQRVPFFGKAGKRVAVIPAEGWAYPAGELHGADTIIAIDVYTRRGIVRHKDERRFKEIWGRYKKDIKEYKKIQAELVASYSAVREEIVSVEFWKGYLEKAAQRSS